MVHLSTNGLNCLGAVYDILMGFCLAVKFDRGQGWSGLLDNNLEGKHAEPDLRQHL